MKFRENTGANSIFTGKRVSTSTLAVATIASGQDKALFKSYHDIAGASDIIVAIGDSDGANADFKSNFTSALTSAGSTFEDPQLAGISRVEGAVWTPALPRTVPHTPALTAASR